MRKTAGGTALACIPCLARQALEAARFVTEEPSLVERIVRETLRDLAEADLSEPPPVIAQRLHRRLRAVSGHPDPYRKVKERFNRLALELLGDLRREVESAEDPLALATRLAIAGNVIDWGANGGIGEDEIRREIAAAAQSPFAGNLEAFRRETSRARHILYLADNAGEIVLDRLLIERLGPERIVLAVRGGAVINDATTADARAAGLEGMLEIIENGSDAPGTVLSDCSPEFLRRFRAADLIVAKGQGNAESLLDEPGEIFFLFKVKCAVMAERFRLPRGTLALSRRSRRGARPAAERRRT